MPPDIRNSIANALPPDSTQFVLIKPGDIKYAYAIDPTNPSGPSRAEILGEGGFATVRKAMWQDKEVAVKLCNLSPTSSNVITTNTIAGGPKQRAQLAQMLLREAQSMHAMKHARVVALLGFVQSNPPSLVMEFMEVGTLKQYIKNNYKTITWSIRLVFMIDVALGMEYLHAKVGPGGEKKAVVFHQDLKTANVLLGHEDGKIRAKISDFGLASLKINKPANERNELETTISDNKTTKTTATLRGGTEVYMAPELQKSKRYSRECDVYSYGVILLELITNSSAIKAMQDYRGQLEILAISNHVPLLLKDFTEICLSRMPSKRPSFTMIRHLLEERRIEFEKTANAGDDQMNNGEMLEQYRIEEEDEEEEEEEEEEQDGEGEGEGEEGNGKDGEEKKTGRGRKKRTKAALGGRETHRHPPTTTAAAAVGGRGGGGVKVEVLKDTEEKSANIFSKNSSSLLESQSEDYKKKRKTCPCVII